MKEGSGGWGRGVGGFGKGRVTEERGGRFMEKVGSKPGKEVCMLLLVLVIYFIEIKR